MNSEAVRISICGQQMEKYWIRGMTMEKTWVEVGLGGTYRFNTNTMAYMDIERSYSSKLTEKWQINAGISWQF